MTTLKYGVATEFMCPHAVAKGYGWAVVSALVGTVSAHTRSSFYAIDFLSGDFNRVIPVRHIHSRRLLVARALET